MSDDDDLDLGAWDAPPAPANLADRVIDRMHAGAAAVAQHHRVRSQRVRLISGIAFGVAAGAIGWWAIRPDHQPAPVAMEPVPMGGGIAVDKPSSITVGNSRAELAPGARVEWHDNSVKQSAGVATWHIGATEHVAIDAGAGVARIDATNASFRIEAKMNLTDVKVIGASATTAAAVALVTVVVYEGHVKVTGAAQQITINAGQAAEIVPGKAPVFTPPPPIEHTVAPEPPTPIHIDAGESVTIHEPDPNREVRVFIDHTCGDAGDHVTLTAKPDSHPYTTTCIATQVQRTGTITLVHDAGDSFARITVPPAPWTDAVKFRVETAGNKYDATAAELELHTGAEPFARVGDTIAVRLEARAGTQILLAHPAVDRKRVVEKYRQLEAVAAETKKPDAKASCDYQHLLEAGTMAEGRGDHVTAFRNYDAALACKPGDAHIIQLAFMASCNEANVANARRMWKQLVPDAKERLKTMCLRAHISEQQLDR